MFPGICGGRVNQGAQDSQSHPKGAPTEQFVTNSQCATICSDCAAVSYIANTGKDWLRPSTSTRYFDLRKHGNTTPDYNENQQHAGGIQKG